jgi:hypothetical protein
LEGATKHPFFNPAKLIKLAAAVGSPSNGNKKTFMGIDGDTSSALLKYFCRSLG